MLTVERVSKLLTSKGIFTTEAGVQSKLQRGLLLRRKMTDNERKADNSKYNFAVDEESFDKYLNMLGTKV